MPIDIEAARAVIAKATPGPWRCVPCGNPLTHDGHCWCAVVDAGEHDKNGVIPSGCASKDDAAFIAAARTALPAALDEVERLRARVAELEAACRQGMHNELVDARAYNKVADERDALRSQLAAVTEARDEACRIAEDLVDTGRYLAGVCAKASIDESYTSECIDDLAKCIHQLAAIGTRASGEEE